MMSLADISIERVASISGISEENSELSNTYRHGGMNISNVEIWGKNSDNIKPPDPEKIVSRYLSENGIEKINTVDQVLDVYSKYMGYISRNVEQKISAGKNPGEISTNASKQRALGGEDFKGLIGDSRYFSSEVLEPSVNSINVITQMMCLIDIDSYNSNKVSGEKGSSVISNLVNLSVLEPESVDKILKVVKDCCPRDKKYQVSYVQKVEGAISEIVSLYSVINTNFLREDGYSIEKPSPYDDALRGMDFVIRDKKGLPLLYFDVKKGNPASYGICSLCLDNARNINAYSSGILSNHLIYEYDIQDNVKGTLSKGNIPFIVVRVPPKFSNFNDALGFEVFDEESYNAFGECLRSEVKHALKKESEYERRS